MGGGTSKYEDEESSSSKTDTVALTASSQVLDQSTQQKDELSKCPMHNSDGNGYSYNWTSIFRAAAVHGPQGTKPLPEERVKTIATASGKDGKGDIDAGGCLVKNNVSSAFIEGEGGGCPVNAHAEYNVYSQPIDKTNNAPKGVGTQLPNATQTTELSTERVSSTIPKGGTDDSVASTWTYPSPQQFYNALSRKGKFNASSEESEEDIASVVALHNNMNEKTWAKVVEWEQQTYGNGSAPKLLKFCGRPHDLAPKAALKHYLLGHPLPYDRHDWTVLRDNGTTVRYVIDYYYDESRANESEDSAMPDLHDRSATPSLLVDVRPALDGPANFFARALQMPYRIATEQTSYEMLPLKGTRELETQVKESVDVWKSIQNSRVRQKQREAKLEAIEDDDNDEEINSQFMTSFDIDEDRAKDIALTFAKALENCISEREAMENCESEEDFPKASIDLNICFGKSLCHVQHQSLVKVLGEGNDAKTEVALETLTHCVMLKTAERRTAREQHPRLFKE